MFQAKPFDANNSEPHSKEREKNNFVREQNYSKENVVKPTKQNKKRVQTNNVVGRDYMKRGFPVNSKGDNPKISKEEDSETCSCNSCNCELCIAEQNSISLSDPHLFFQTNAIKEISSQRSAPKSRGNNSTYIT